MKTAMAHRTTLIRMLLLCILFSLYACGLHHGQMHGSGDEPTQLSEANLSHHHHGHADSEPPATPHHSFTPAFTCPLCSSYAPAVAINSLDWSMARRNFNGHHAILNGYGSMAGARHDAAAVPFVEVIGTRMRL